MLYVEYKSETLCSIKTLESSMEDKNSGKLCRKKTMGQYEIENSGTLCKNSWILCYKFTSNQREVF